MLDTTIVYGYMFGLGLGIPAAAALVIGITCLYAKRSPSQSIPSGYYNPYEMTASSSAGRPAATTSSSGKKRNRHKHTIPAPTIHSAMTAANHWPMLAATMALQQQQHLVN